MDQRHFAVAELAFNIGGAMARLKEAECNPGGSYICTTGTKGCDAGLTCVGTSTKHDFGCEAGSDDMFDLGLNARILVERTQIEGLRKELQAVVARYGQR